MTRSLRISDSLSLPLDTVTDTIGVVAGRGELRASDALMGAP